MARDRQEWFTTNANVRLVDDRTGEVAIEYPISGNYVRSVSRPDPISVPLVNGFRSPTSWKVVDHQPRPFWVGDAGYVDNYGSRWEYSGELLGAIGESEVPAADTYQFPLNLRSRTETEALLRIKSQKVQLSVALAEMHKSVDMIAQRTSTIVQAVKYARKGRFKKAADLLGVSLPKGFKSSGKSAANGWLELQYGWLPLLGDIQGAYDLGTQKMRTFGQVVSAKRILKETRVRPISSGSMWTTSINDTVEFTCVVALSYSVRNEALSFAAQAGLDNPATVAWELTPFSFLLDWFIPIGNWLDAFTATQGLDFKAGTLTQVTRVTREGTLSGNPYYKSFGDAKMNQQSFCMDRSLYSGTPMPGIYYKSPASVMHGLNALALLRSIINGK